MATPLPSVGPLLASINDLSAGRIDVSDKSHNLRAGLDALLQSYEARENMYTEAVKNIQDNYNSVLNEAVQIADGYKAAAAEEAKNIVNTAKKETEEWEAEKAKLAVIQKFEPRVKLDVGGVKFTTSLTTLCRFPDTMIGAMFSGRHALHPDQEGYHFIDRDGTHFRYILNYLRSPETFKAEITGAVLNELKGECDYYGLLGLMFPFKPMTSLSLTSSGNQHITVNQDASGIWRLGSDPLLYCVHCGSAHSAGSRINYFPQFLATITSKNGMVFPGQCKCDTVCFSCGRL